MICRGCKLNKKNTQFKNCCNLLLCKDCQELIDNGQEVKDLSNEFQFCTKCEQILPYERFLINEMRSNRIRLTLQCDSCRPRKTCIDCEKLLTLSSYNKKGIRNCEQRYESRCKKCHNKHRRRAPIRKREADRTYLCRVCDETKDEKLFYDSLKESNVRRGTCRKCQKKKMHLNNLESIRLLKPMYLRNLLNSRFRKTIVYAHNQENFEDLLKKAKNKIILERDIREDVSTLKKSFK